MEETVLKDKYVSEEECKTMWPDSMRVRMRTKKCVIVHITMKHYINACTSLVPLLTFTHGEICWQKSEERMILKHDVLFRQNVIAI